MRRAFLLALLLVSCKDDPPTSANCTSKPDFEVLIAAAEGPLPPDAVVSIEYGGGEMEQYALVGPNDPHVLFCDPSDREGNPVTGGSGGEAGEAASSGRTGGGGEPSGHAVEALHCELWTDGPATLTVETAIYPSVVVPLHAKQGKCTVTADVEIGPEDGGA